METRTESFLMSSVTIDIRDLPGRFAELLATAAKDEIIITDGQVPRAKLVPLPSGQPRVPGLHPGAIAIADDFDAPLPDNFWAGDE
jgi:antitoxin (DNA-binding transcriptional repressor) of toxin-antitoxin stability system